jgi:hypothetical protein
MDTTKQIMNKWYSAMEVNNISVQPKAATILGTILSEYTISKKEEEKDLWSEFLTITGGQFKGWYESLSEEDLKLFHEQRSKAKKTNYKDKTLLKG